MSNLGHRNVSLYVVMIEFQKKNQMRMQHVVPMFSEIERRKLNHVSNKPSVLAAQSICKPARQMTVNTFHVAGVSIEELGEPPLRNHSFHLR